MQQVDLDKYLHVKTGEDLVKLGVVPKSSSRHLALITALRLEAIRDAVQQGITPEMLGEWIPAIAADEQNLGSVLNDPNQILQYAKPDMRVRGTATVGGTDLRGLEGRVVGRAHNQTLNIAWEGISGSATSRVDTPPTACELVLDEPLVIRSNYRLAEEVVADPQLGHKVTFAEAYTGRTKSGAFEIPKGTTGMLLSQDDKKGGEFEIQFDTPLNSTAKAKLPIDEDMYRALRASSLGQIVPLDLEDEVRKQTVAEFFPRTRLAQQTAEQVITGMLFGRDQIFYGPAGAGKSSLAKDIIQVAMQQEVSFIVDGCQAQCNPFSLFDAEFAKVCPPCPECMIAYDKTFKQTGRFEPPKPRDVKVVPARYATGFGIETKEGTTGLRRYNFTGHKLPKLDGSTTAGRESDFDPEGYHAGFLVRTNNGVLCVEEGDKLRPDVLDNLLEALQSDLTQPDQIRFPYPANAVVLMTANDGTVFSGPLRDRMRLIFIGYPTDVDVSYQITRVSYHGERSSTSTVAIPDSHPMKGNIIRRTPVPAPLERAVDALMVNFRANYDLAKRDQTLTTNRCKFDALDAARALLFLDQQFHPDSLTIPDAQYLMRGFAYAVLTRIAEPDVHKRDTIAQELGAWVANTMPKLIVEEENAWWCNFNKHLSVADARVHGAAAHAAREFKEYADDPQNAFAAHRRLLPAHQQPNDRTAQLQRIKHPFMDYLFRNQPALLTATEPQVVALAQYFTESRNRALPKAPG